MLFVEDHDVVIVNFDLDPLVLVVETFQSGVLDKKIIFGIIIVGLNTCLCTDQNVLVLNTSNAEQ